MRRAATRLTTERENLTGSCWTILFRDEARMCIRRLESLISLSARLCLLWFRAFGSAPATRVRETSQVPVEAGKPCAW